MPDSDLIREAGTTHVAGRCSSQVSLKGAVATKQQKQTKATRNLQLHDSFCVRCFKHAAKSATGTKQLLNKAAE